MSHLEYTVIVVGLLVGYWIVSRVMASNSGVAQKTGRADSKDANTDDPTRPFSETKFPSSWEHVLGIPRSSKVEEIRRVYKIQMSQYHPDKVATLGIELRSLAERKSKEIASAYRQAMVDHGVVEQP